MQYVWPVCLSHLMQWTLTVPGWASSESEDFSKWHLLKRVLAIVVIRELQNMLGHSDNNESLPQYLYHCNAYKDVEQLLWLHEVGRSPW